MVAIKTPLKIKKSDATATDLNSCAQELSKNFLAGASFDVIFIQETWYDDSITDEVVTHGTNFTMARKDRDLIKTKKKDGEGVAFLINNKIPFLILDSIQCKLAEILAIQITEKKKF